MIDHPTSPDFWFNAGIADFVPDLCGSSFSVFCYA